MAVRSQSRVVSGQRMRVSPPSGQMKGARCRSGSGLQDENQRRGRLDRQRLRVLSRRTGFIRIRESLNIRPRKTMETMTNMYQEDMTPPIKAAMARAEIT